MNKVLLFFFGILVCFSCQEKEKNTFQASDSKLDRVASYLDTISQEGFSGSVLVAYKGELLSEGYGESDRSKQVDNTVETVYDIGSITKQFTGAAILKLEMMEMLTLDKTLGDYFKEAPEDKKDITVHQLLTHSSGLIDWIGDDYDPISEADFVRLVLGSDLLHEPGSKHHYSNLGYSLLSLIIEKVSGQSYEQFLSEKLFQPAGMKHTGYSIPNWQGPTIAVGYRGESGMGKPNEQNWDGGEPYLHLKGNGGILSTVTDMYKWHQALLGDDILNEDAKKKFYHPHIKENASGNSSYGYGWAIFPTPRNTQLITHNGGNGIFFGDFLRYLSEDITIILLSNSASNHTERVAWQIAGTLLVDDFEPLMPSDMTNEEEASRIDDFVLDAFLAIRDGNPETWETLLQAHASKEFLNAAPMETHLKFFEKFKKRLQKGEVVGIWIDDDEVISEVKTQTENLKLILGVIEDGENELKLEGIKIEEAE